MHIQTDKSAILTSLSCFFILVTPICLGGDTITANRPLSWNQTLVSATGIFELGFFTPGNSSKYYIGLWYHQVSEKSILWVANRDKPIFDKYSSHLKILRGNLVLTTGRSNTTIWSTNMNHIAHSRSTEAVLLDSGNLVLRNGPNSSHPLWQSADYPTDVWLPGYKIGVDKRTGFNRVLTSWKNSEDPSPGLFTHQLDLNGTIQFVHLWNGTETYWRSGAWNPVDQSFALLPELKNKPKNSYHYTVVDNKNETYFTYYVKSHAVPSRLVMDVSGQLKSFTWRFDNQRWILLLSQPGQICDVFSACGAFGSCNQKSLPYCDCLHGFQPKEERDWNLNDYSSGCSRKTQLQCVNSSYSQKKDRFWVNPDVGLPGNPQTVKVVNREDCESACLSNCSCTAYSYDSDGCSVWKGGLLNVKQLSDGDSNGKTLYIRLNAAEFHTNSNKKRVVGIVVGSAAAALSAFLGVVWLMIWGRKRLSVGPVIIDGSLVQFRYKDLQSATKNFSEKLGGGGFGSVFRGRLADTSLIAVKMLEGVTQGEKQFRAEVSTVGKIQHVNLVRLCGFCSEGSKRLLVYEYMPNGSLNTHLFGGKDSIILSWKTRYQVALGTAKGLAYLHESCRDCIIHCDIKPENILLDAEFTPKIADFGLAKLVGREFSRVLTTMRGTRGYLAPEWISGAAITAKADVYSYGMMLFEFISGRRNTEQLEDEEFNFFPTTAVKTMSEGEDIFSILDQKLEGNADREEVMRLCKLACWCIQDDENRRPTMGQVVQILEGVLDVNMPPMPRSLQIFADNHSQILCFTEGPISQASSYSTATSTETQSMASYVTAISQG